MMSERCREKSQVRGIERLMPVDEEEEIGTLETLPSAISFCMENHKALDEYDLDCYPSNTTLKIGEIGLVKNAP